jgi:CRP-like cAMP-binding protein
MFSEKLFKSFDCYLPLNRAERTDLSARLAERRLKRRQYILQQNDICNHFTFIAEGCLRKFYIDNKGVEHNIQFATENDWITEYDSFYSVKPSMLSIEAIEPSVILQISRKDLLFLFLTNAKYDRNFRVIAEKKYIELEKRILESAYYGAEERYISFLSRYPELAGRLPNLQIASYLGITPEFFSKVKTKVTSR